MASNGKVNGNSEAGNNSKSKEQKISELYSRGKSRIHSDIEKEEKFLKYIKEISEEREKLRRKPKLKLIKFLLPILIVGFGIFLMYLPEKRIIGKNIFEFSPPPEFHFEIGRYTVINFFASWCSSCESEIPQVIDFYRSATDTSVIGVAINDFPENINALIRKYGINYPVIYDNGVFSKKLGIDSLPVTLVLDPELRIRKIIYGPVTKEKLLGSIRKLKEARSEK